MEDMDRNHQKQQLLKKSFVGLAAMVKEKTNDLEQSQDYSFQYFSRNQLYASHHPLFFYIFDKAIRMFHCN
jgi:nitrate/nitrite-specific signal transduction histidine kinase